MTSWKDHCHSGLWRIDEETRWETSCVFIVTHRIDDDDDLLSDSSRGHGEKWLDSR